MDEGHGGIVTIRRRNDRRDEPVCGTHHRVVDDATMPIRQQIRNGHRAAVLPHRSRIDRVDDHLRRCVDELNLGEEALVEDPLPGR